jgi:hypothetical protein
VWPLASMRAPGGVRAAVGNRPVVGFPPGDRKFRLPLAVLTDLTILRSTCEILI